MRKPTFWFFTWSSTNHAVQLKMMATGLKVQALKAVRLYLEKKMSLPAWRLLQTGSAYLFLHLQNVVFLMTQLNYFILEL